MLLQPNSQWHKKTTFFALPPPQLWTFSCYKHLSCTYISTRRGQVVTVFLIRHNIFSSPVLALLELPKRVKVYKPRVEHI